MVTPEQISNLNASLRYGMQSFASRLVGQAVRREEAIARLVAVAPDPDMLDALGALPTSGLSADQIRLIAHINANGGMRAPQAAPTVRAVPLDAVLAVFRDGDEIGWDVEFTELWRGDPERMEELRLSILAEGIREPILLGRDGRVWDGHHRLAVAHRIRYATVPVTFAGEEATS